METLSHAPPQLSVLVATYNRGPRLLRLLEDLSAQTLPAHGFEVVVVDDGSREPALPLLESVATSFALRAVSQANAGAAAARDRAARLARGEVLVIVDDDMRLPPGFLEAHFSAHVAGTRRVVLGPIEPDSAAQQRAGIFEVYNAHRLRTWGEALVAGRARLRGNNLCTGNVSFRRADYLAVGGFDLSLRRSEDAELGLRLEQAGSELVFAPGAATRHDSDHSDTEWLRRAYEYGVVDRGIARKHPSLAHADPWRYWFTLPRLGRPFLWLSLVAPGLSRLSARAALSCASAADRAGLRALALRGAGLAYGSEYFRGLREAEGSLRAALRARLRFLALAAGAPEPLSGVPRRRAHFWKAIRDLRIDRVVRGQYEDKYGYQGERGRSFAGELIQKIGLQMAAAYRAMRFFRAAGFPLFARITARLMRHLFGCDIHWDADLAAGVVFVHGMGIAISNRARVGPGCILSQNVTLGMGVDPLTREQGAPTLEANVHVGGGASLFGPIRIGAGSKIMPNAVLAQSVPPGSLVEVPPPVIRPRKPQAIPEAPPGRTELG
jgi:serine acetyltransferase/GT2 family glycosyltransferase